MRCQGTSRFLCNKFLRAYAVSCSDWRIQKLLMTTRVIIWNENMFNHFLRVRAKCVHISSTNGYYVAVSARWVRSNMSKKISIVYGYYVRWAEAAEVPACLESLHFRNVCGVKYEAAKRNRAVTIVRKHGGCRSKNGGVYQAWQNKRIVETSKLSMASSFKVLIFFSNNYKSCSCAHWTESCTDTPCRK